MRQDTRSGSATGGTGMGKIGVYERPRRFGTRLTFPLVLVLAAVIATLSAVYFSGAGF